MITHLSGSVKKINLTDPVALKEQFLMDLEEVFCRENTEENANKFIVFNFWRRYRKFSAGHICPLAGYHKPSNTVLILDVAAYVPTIISNNIINCPRTGIACPPTGSTSTCCVC